MAGRRRKREQIGFGLIVLGPVSSTVVASWLWLLTTCVLLVHRPT
jgi:hypothetical protein